MYVRSSSSNLAEDDFVDDAIDDGLDMNVVGNAQDVEIGCKGRMGTRMALQDSGSRLHLHRNRDAQRANNILLLTDMPRLVLARFVPVDSVLAVDLVEE